MVPSEQDRPDKVSLTLVGRPVTDQNQPAQQANQFPELLSNLIIHLNPNYPLKLLRNPKKKNPSILVAPPSIMPLVRSLCRRSSLWSARSAVDHPSGPLAPPSYYKLTSTYMHTIQYKTKYKTKYPQ